MIETTHAALNRIVLTYERDGWPAGVLTGYDNDDGGLCLEHVIAWKPGALRPLLQEGLLYAWSKGAPYVTFCLAAEQGKRAKLARLGKRFGALRYESDERFEYFVVHR